MTSFIYFVQANGHGPIKIGTTGDNPRKRMVKIQSDCPWTVTLLGAIEGTLAQEKEIQAVLSPWCIQGEWFDPHPIVLAAVEAALECGVLAPFDQKAPSEINEGWHPLRKWRETRDLSQAETGVLIGVPPATISRWERNKFLPNRRFWKRIELVTGIDAETLAGCLQQQMMEAAQ